MSSKIVKERGKDIESALKSGKAVIIHPAASKKFKGNVLTIDYPRLVA